MNIFEVVKETVEYIENFVVMQVLCDEDFGVDHEIGHWNQHIIKLYIKKDISKKVLLNIECEECEDRYRFNVYSCGRSNKEWKEKTDYYFKQIGIPANWDNSFNLYGEYEDLLKYLKYILEVRESE